MENIRIFNYDHNQITFQLENGDIMVNITEMAKPFGKMPYDFLRLEQTKQFIEALNKKVVTGIPVTEIKQGGNIQGTWAHQKLALKFAGWLNPEFELWVYDRIEELLKNGYTKVDSISRKELALMLLAAEEEKEQLEKDKERLQAQTELQQKEIEVAAPKVEYYEKVLDSKTLIPISVVAKDLGTSAMALNKWLHDQKIIYKVGDTWLLYAQYQGKELTGTKTVTYKDSSGNDRTSIQTCWTEKGRQFIITKYNNLHGRGLDMAA